ncbi:MAG: carbohydrate ABC transporter substrate-binding protein, partial [Chloroflexota bacterium]
MQHLRKVSVLTLALLLVLAVPFAGAQDEYMAAAERWIDEEFQPASISREEQMAEMEWFIQACEPYRGMEIRSTAENIRTH